MLDRSLPAARDFLTKHSRVSVFGNPESQLTYAKRLLSQFLRIIVELTMKRIDNHSHIIHAGIGEMVGAARSNRVDEYSITEHVSQFRELRESIGFGSVHSTGRIFESLKEYGREFRRIDESIGFGMRIHRGLEVDYSPRYEIQVGDFVNQEEWDILLCSVHEFEDGKDVEMKTGRTDDRGLGQERWRDYFRLQCMAIESDFCPFTVLAHPVRMSKGMMEEPPDIDALLLELAETAEKKGRALELNGNDIDYNRGLVRKLASASSKAGCRVSVGSDAHYPRDVFRNMLTASNLVEEFKLQLV